MHQFEIFHEKIIFYQNNVPCKVFFLKRCTLQGISESHIAEKLIDTECFVGGRVVRWFWVNFQFRGGLLIWMIVGQGSIALAVGAGGVGLDIFTLLYPFSPLSPSLWETARYRLKYCFKGPFNPKQSNPKPNASRLVYMNTSRTK